MPVTLVIMRRRPRAAEGGTGECGEPDLPAVSFDGPRVVIGRSGSCDLRIPDASVSSRHASIRAQGAQWAVVDEGSTNGTRVNGEKLGTHSPRPIKSGDTVTIGRVDITVRIGAAPASNAQATRELALALVARSIGDEGAVAAAIVVCAGPDEGARLDLTRDQPRMIGRDPRCALRLTDKAIPPTAIEVVLEAGRVRVSVKDPRVEVRLGERAITDAVTWPDGTEVHLGNTTLVLDDPLARALDQSAHGDDEKLAPESIAPPPEPVIEAAPVEEVAAAPRPVARRTHDRRGSWRGATLAFEIVAAIVALVVLAGSIAGLYWLLRK